MSVLDRPAPVVQQYDDNAVATLGEQLWQEKNDRRDSKVSPCSSARVYKENEIYYIDASGTRDLAE